jgi:hypothetical protein
MFLLVLVSIRCGKVRQSMGSEFIDHFFLTLILNGELHALAPLPREKKIPHFIEGCVLPRAGLNAVEKRELLTLPGHEI